MIIAGRYSFNRGVEEVQARSPQLLREIEAIIAAVDSSNHFIKVSEEKTMPGKVLYSPRSLNKAFAAEFLARGWRPVRVRCEYSTDYYEGGYSHPAGATTEPRRSRPSEFREMDFVKDKLGVEVQFGRHPLAVSSVCAKMTIFRNLGHIELGVEIVPIKDFAEHMSGGVSFFEQMVWDLERRGCGNIDVPVIILGVNTDGGHPAQPASGS